MEAGDEETVVSSGMRQAGRGKTGRKGRRGRKQEAGQAKRRADRE